MNYIKPYLILLFACFVTLSQAQTGTPCIDSNRMDPFFQCSANDFAPVCACDGKTYLNLCAATNRHGINTTQYNGVCQGELFFYSFWPNPLVDYMSFYMQVARDKATRATVQIFDIYGNQVYFKLLTFVPDEYAYVETIFLSGLRSGVYVIVVGVDGLYKAEKFVKHTF